MKFHLEINLNNDAFQPEPFAELELALRNVASLIAPGKEHRSGTVRDSNGNTVGTFRLERSVSQVALTIDRKIVRFLMDKLDNMANEDADYWLTRDELAVYEDDPEVGQEVRDYFGH